MFTKMPKLILVISYFTLCTSGVEGGMDCTFGQGNVFEKVLSHCPGLLDSNDLEYCCLDSNSKFYCCNIYNFILTGGGILNSTVVVIILVCLAASILISCICCLCCPFCCLYRRRNCGSFV